MPKRSLVGRQVMVVALCLVILVLDGMDVQALAFAAPVILREWDLSTASLSPAMAASLIGMAIGSAIGGWLGDRIGRRAVTVICAFAFGSITVATATASGVDWLALLRFAAGIGFGAAIPNAMALTAEWTPARVRGHAIALLAVGVPLGGMVGALGAGVIIPHFGWRGCFLAGGSLTILFAIILLFCLPESPAFGAQRSIGCAGRPPELAFGSDALDRSQVSYVQEREGMAWEEALFGARYLRTTLSLMVGFFCSLFGCYAMTTWLPTALRISGLSLAEALDGAFYYNIASIAGALLSGYILIRLGSRRALALATALSAVAALGLVVGLTHRLGSTNDLLDGVIALLGAFMAIVQSVFYALANFAFPTRIRTHGSGLAMAAGRTGGILAILLAGRLLALPGRPAAVFVAVVIAAMGGVMLAVLAFDRHSRPSPRTRMASGEEIL